MMRIAVTAAEAGPHAAPLRRVFEYAGLDDEVLAASAARIRDMLARGMRLNVNDALLMFAAYVAVSVGDGRDGRRIAEEARGMLEPHNVMVGVPEMLYSMRFELDMDGLGRAATVSIDRPIEIGRQGLWPEGGGAAAGTGGGE